MLDNIVINVKYTINKLFKSCYTRVNNPSLLISSWIPLEISLSLLHQSISTYYVKRSSINLFLVFHHFHSLLYAKIKRESMIWFLYNSVSRGEHKIEYLTNHRAHACCVKVHQNLFFLFLWVVWWWTMIPTWDMSAYKIKFE